MSSSCVIREGVNTLPEMARAHGNALRKGPMVKKAQGQRY